MLVMFYHSFLNIFYFLARIDRACYCPQESICMNVNIYSQALKNFVSKLKLIKFIKYQFDGKEHIEKEIILHARG